MDVNKSEAQSRRERLSGFGLDPACIWHIEQYELESIYKRSSGKQRWEFILRPEMF